MYIANMALTLRFALNLENLADEMIEKISSVWKSPFDAPIVIFPDAKLEQWFRLRWLEKKGTLANFNKTSVDRFLFDILVGENDKLKKLSSDMLRNVIISYLSSKNTDGKYNYETLTPNGDLKKYLETDGKINAKRLFDLANTLSALFLEYEISRPSGFISNEKGILDCWKENNLSDFFVKKNKSGKFESVKNEDWERELYSKIFHNINGKSLLTSVFEKAAENNEIPANTRFLTLPFLYKECLNSENKPVFKYNKKVPVFIFGLSGLGQFYRIVLREFASQYDIYAYIQNPCMQFWEDHKFSRSVKIPTTLDGQDFQEENYQFQNPLLQAWGKAGCDNIKLWCLSDDYSTCEFPEKETEKNEKPVSNKLLHLIQHSIANRFSAQDLQNSIQQHKISIHENDESLTIDGAPSKIREIENLHSRLCQLLLNGANLNEILIVSPNLEEYRSAIYQIFNQAKIKAEKELSSSQKTTLYIPYNIIDSAQKDSHINNALAILFNIKKSKNISRPDFFNLLKNPVIQAVWKIDDYAISCFENWVKNINIYRNKPEKESDWTLGVKRLLLAKLTNDSFALNENIFFPYSNLDTSNNSLLLKFINAIESLENWIKDFDEELKESDLNSLQDFLNSWLALPYFNEDLAEEIFIYQEVLKTFNNLKYFFFAGNEKLSLDIISQCLTNSAISSEYSFGSLFVNGVTFMKFAPNRTIPVKHLFFIGADSNTFPGTSISNTLDLRKSLYPWPGDDSKQERNRYAFLCQLTSTSESFHISYQNANLTKDSEIFPTPLINDLIHFVKDFSSKEILKINSIPLDETRNIDSIFTRRALRYKQSINKINSPQSFENELTSREIAKTKKSLPSKIKLKDLSKFLKDPFIFFAENKMNFKENNISSTEISFEPIELNNLDKSIFLNQSIAISLGLNCNYTDLDTFLKSSQQMGNIPYDEFGERVIKELKENVKFFCKIIQNKFPEEKYEYSSLSLNLPLEIDLKKEKHSVHLYADIPLLIKNSTDKTENFIVICKDKAYKNDIVKIMQGILEPYIYALALLASNEVEKIDICLINQNEPIRCSISQDSNLARNILQKIFEKAFVEEYKKILPFSLFNENIESFEGLKEKLSGNHGPWSYFSGKTFFDITDENISGFSDDDNVFKESWNREIQEQRELVKDLEGVTKWN